MNENTATKSARAVLQAHIDALNAHDEARLGETLHFPHFRLSGAELKVWETPESYFGDFRKRAGSQWVRSEFENVKVLQTSDEKVHLGVEVVRYSQDGSVIDRFSSLWVITLEQGIWAAKIRSSFAAI